MSHNEKEIIKHIAYGIGALLLAGMAITMPLYVLLGGTGAALAVQWVVVIVLLVLVWKEGKIVRVRTQGAGGERRVKTVLRKLDERFRVLGNVVIGNKGDIDFVVVGPTGVWVIEVKSHKGRIRVDGDRLLRDNKIFDKDFLRQVRGATYALKDELRKRFPQQLYIQPAVVFSSPYAKLGIEWNKADDTYVIGLAQLNALLERQEVQRLSADEIARITDAIRSAVKRK